MVGRQSKRPNYYSTIQRKNGAPKTKIKEKSSRFWNSDFLTNPCDMDLPRYKMNLNQYSPTL